MELKIFRNGTLRSNSYALIGENRQAVLIDAGSHYDYYKSQQQEGDFTIKYVLFTHGHFDHITAGAKLQQSGAQCGISVQDANFLHTKDNLASMAGFANDNFKADFTFKDGEILNLCGIDFKVIHTPGHTHGSVCFLAEDMLFSGDTLFAGNIGRTDFPTGSYTDLIKSVQNKLFILDDKTRVYPGHEEQTTLAYEKKYNPYVGQAQD